ncbi:MAG: AMP-binding protein [Rubrivivax sp.]|nr:AMP-binding protein [Rubrivivax sp.]
MSPPDPTGPSAPSAPDPTSAPSAPGTPATEVLPRLLALVESTLRDLQGAGAELPPVTADSVLDRDLGLDSLARMELLLRVERAFGVDLPEETLQRSETVADLLRAVHGAAPATGTDRGAAAPARPLPAEAGAPDDTSTGDLPDHAATLTEVLAWHVRRHAAQVQHVVLHDAEERAVTYGQLADAAAATAAGLQHRGIVPRQCIAIMLPTSEDYFAVYLGILLAGAIPVPIYPPARPSQLQDHVLRHAGILRNAGAVALVTVPEAMTVARLLRAQVPGLRFVVTPAQLAEGGGAPTPVALHADDIAFIQYTSGSTGQPKGVALTHANLLANIRAMAAAVQATRRDVFVSWLPLYHDMGLIGAWLAPLYVGFPLVVMSPLAFLSRPLRWLQAIHRWRGTLSAGPNFAYELCLSRIDDADLAGLDLGCWRLAFNGAEAVSPDTVRRFVQRFAPCGLAPEALAPVYGLAEASVGLLFPPLGRVAPVDCIDRAVFASQRRALPVAAETPGALRFVGCGRALPGHEVRIVDDAGHELPERAEGRLEFRGPSATRGYFHNPAQTARLFHDGWLDTGDRAYLADGDVYVTGRVKDIVIRGGRNLYPQEIEEAVGAVAGVRKGCVAVFGSPDPATGTERLVVLAEARAMAAPARQAVHDAVVRAVVDAIGEPPDEVVLAPPHTVLKTSSGKVRRSACRERYEAGLALAEPAAVSRQWLTLAAAALRLRMQDAASALRRGLAGLRIGGTLVLFAAPTWLATQSTRDPAVAWARGRAAARQWLRAAGLPLHASGLPSLPAGPCVLVANHASYFDGLLLVAALPRPFAFVAKRELAAQFVAGRFLARLGALFVERADVRRSVADAERMVQAVGQGRSLAVFPEGTFVAEPGLLPFHLGAFLAAARAGVPVVPVVIVGSRSLLPAGVFWPRPAALCVEVCPAVMPSSSASDLFAAAVQLRDAARQAIARRLDE